MSLIQISSPAPFFKRLRRNPKPFFVSVRWGQLHNLAQKWGVGEQGVGDFTVDSDLARRLECHFSGGYCGGGVFTHLTALPIGGAIW